MGVPFTGLAGEVVPGVSGVLVCGLNLRVEASEEAVPRAYEMLRNGESAGRPKSRSLPVHLRVHHRLGEGVEAQLQVGENIVDVLNTDSKADEVRVHANLLQLLSGKLRVGGGGGVNHERAHVTDIRHVGV